MAASGLGIGGKRANSSLTQHKTPDIKSQFKKNEFTQPIKSNSVLGHNANQMMLRGNNGRDQNAHSALNNYTNTELPGLTNQKLSLREASQERKRGPGSRNASVNVSGKQKQWSLNLSVLQNNAAPSSLSQGNQKMQHAGL